MIIVFTESFELNGWNGYNARYIKGVSGSHNGPMYLAEGLADAGHRVYFVSIINVMEPREYNGVVYCNLDNFQTLEYCDLIVTTNNVRDLHIFKKIDNYKRLAFVMHNELFNNDPNNMHNFMPFYHKANDRLSIIFLNQNAKDNILRMQDFLIPCVNAILPNCLNLKEIIPFQAEKKENAFVFFPVIERGYGMVRDLLNYFPDFKLIINTYDTNNLQFINSNHQIEFTENSSKLKVYNALSRGKYFVYSLVNYEKIHPYYDKGSIHYDTFGYVVLEALLHGVIVIAPKMEVFEELFGDAICYIDTEDIIPKHFMSKWKQQNENFGKPILNRYVDKIKFLEDHPEVRQQYIEKGLEVGKKFCHKTVAKRYLEARFPVPSIST